METVPAKTIVTKTKSPDEWFGVDYNMNIYRGCPHGCIYCDSRSVCYQNPDFGTVKVKENAIEIIRDDLRRKTKRGVVATGAMSDPYNPFEQKLCLTRNALEILDFYQFGVAIDTKSTLVTRDIDVLQKIKAHSPVLVKMTVTTADPDLCSKVEPHVSGPQERFAAIKTVSDAGIFCGVLMMPILPFINDTEDNIRAITEQAKEAGARFVYPAMGMTLREGNREYYYEKLDELFPNMKQKYMEAYGDRYGCTSHNAKRLWAVFAAQCERLGLLYEMKSIIAGYKGSYNQQQPSLF